MAKPKDANTPLAQIVIRDFSGVVTNSDPFDLPEGAAVEQTNATCIVPGTLTPRPGIRKVNFED